MARRCRAVKDEDKIRSSVEAFLDEKLQVFSGIFRFGVRIEHERAVAGLRRRLARNGLDNSRKVRSQLARALDSEGSQDLETGGVGRR